MLQKKICLLGAFAVGKTSLVARFVTSMFDDKYLTTMGVKVDKKIVQVDDKEVNLLLWDVAGEDEFQKVQLAYLRGSSAYILVCDGTRAVTLDQARDIRKRVEESVGQIPCILVVNKSDLIAEWEITETNIDALRNEGWTVFTSSAKTGEHVEEVFATLAGMTVGG